MGPKTHQLVALYFDTPDLRLAARGITLRRRRGGTDPGWHLKLPKAKGVRQEITRPLTRSAKIVPPELVDLVLAYTRGAPLAPIAELDTRRTVTTLVNAAGIRLVEIADDRVKGTVFNAEKHVERWREVEAELIEGEEKLLKKIGKQLTKAGASPADSASKLARLLNAAGPVPEQQRAETQKGSAGEVVVDYISSQVSALLAQDPRVRGAEEDAVHQMRVASRRLRSVLKSFKTVIEGTENVQDELKWLGEVLGEARDLEVIRERFAHRLDSLDQGLIVGSDPGSPQLRPAGQGARGLRADQGDAQRRTLLRPARRPRRPGRHTRADQGRREAGADALDAVAAKNWRPGRQGLRGRPGHRGARRARARDARRAQGGQAGPLHRGGQTLGKSRSSGQAGRGRTGGAGHLPGRRRRAGAAVAKEAETARLAGEDTFTYGVLIGVERAAARARPRGVPQGLGRDHGRGPIQETTMTGLTGIACRDPPMRGEPVSGRW